MLAGMFEFESGIKNAPQTSPPSPANRSSSSGRSNVTENLFPERVVTRAWPRTFRLALLDKDLGVALKVLEDNGVPSGAIRIAREAFAAARPVLGEEADHVEFVKEIEKAAGVEIA